MEPKFIKEDEVLPGDIVAWHANYYGLSKKRDLDKCILIMAKLSDIEPEEWEDTNGWSYRKFSAEWIRTKLNNHFNPYIGTTATNLPNNTVLMVRNGKAAILLIARK